MKLDLRIVTSLSLPAVLFFDGDARAQLPSTVRASVDSNGLEGNGNSTRSAISANDRFVAYYSAATNLVAGDSNQATDVFVFDRTTAVTQRVSVATSGAQAAFGCSSFGVSISADGRFVAFYSYAPNFVAGDANGTYDVFVRDRTNATTECVSVTRSGTLGNHGGVSPSISTDGRFVAFESGSTDLVANDTNGAADVFVRDRLTGTTARASVDTFGAQANSGATSPAISADGRYIAFESFSTNLVAGDTNGKTDAFVRDCFSHTTVRVSESAANAQANHESYSIDITGDGSLVVFDGLATNLVVGDTNSAADVFTRTNCFAQYPDADGDGYGAVVASQPVCVPAAGWSLNALDCDDTNATRHPGAPDLLDGYDEDCDGSIDEDIGGATYCTAGTSYHGCLPQISASGAPSASAASGYTVVVQSVPGQRTGMIFYGLSPEGTPWGQDGASFSCVALPRQRMAALSTGGTQWQCNGQLALDVQAWTLAHPGTLGTPLQAGQTLYFQAWYRDQGAPKHSSLSGGWVVRFGP